MKPILLRDIADDLNQYILKLKTTYLQKRLFESDFA